MSWCCWVLALVPLVVLVLLVWFVVVGETGEEPERHPADYDPWLEERRMHELWHDEEDQTRGR